MARRDPDLRVHEDAGVEPDDVLALLDHRPPPRPLDVVLQLDAERAVVPDRVDPAVDLARREHEAAPLRERDDRVEAGDGWRDIGRVGHGLTVTADGSAGGPFSHATLTARAEGLSTDPASGSEFGHSRISVSRPTDRQNGEVHGCRTTRGRLLEVCTCNVLCPCWSRGPRLQDMRHHDSWASTRHRRRVKVDGCIMAVSAHIREISSRPSRGPRRLHTRPWKGRAGWLTRPMLPVAGGRHREHGREQQDEVDLRVLLDLGPRAQGAPLLGVDVTAELRPRSGRRARRPGRDVVSRCRDPVVPGQRRQHAGWQRDGIRAAISRPQRAPGPLPLRGVSDARRPKCSSQPISAPRVATGDPRRIARRARGRGMAVAVAVVASPYGRYLHHESGVGPLPLEAAVFALGWC